MKCKMVGKKNQAEHQKLLGEWRLSTNLDLQSRLKQGGSLNLTTKKAFAPFSRCKPVSC